MDWNVSVSLFVSVVLWNVVKIISSDDNGSLHFSGDADTLENFSSDGYVAGEWAFLVNIGWFDGLFGGSESKSDVFNISNSGGGFFSEEFFSVQEDVFLFLEGSFGLFLENKVLDSQPLIDVVIKFNIYKK